MSQSNVELFRLTTEVYFAMTKGEVPRPLIQRLGKELGLAGEIRRDHIKLALTSYQELGAVIQDLSEAELHEALNVESQSQRRPVVMERIIRRLVRLAELRAKETLTRQYLGQGSSNQTKKEK